MKKILKWLDDNIELYICVFLMSFMTLLVFVQVVMRYVFNNSPVSYTHLTLPTKA